MAGSAEACDADNGGLTLPDGFCAAVFHEGVGPARHLTVTPEGVVYVAIAQQPGGSGSSDGVVALRDTDDDNRADVMESFGEHHGTGIEVVGSFLYVSTDTSVIRYPLPAGDAMVPTAPAEVVVAGFPVQRAHASKPLAFDSSGSMWVTVGAPTNACGGQTDRQSGATGLDPCPDYERQAAVWQFDADRTNQTQTDGERYAWGIRNAVAVAYHPAGDGVWVVQHGRDQLNTVDSANFTAEENATRPAEELLRLEEGTAYSWPYCFYDLETNRRVLTPEYGGTGDEVGRCADFPEPVAVYDGHWAPNDLLFYTGDQFPDPYQNGAFIAFHGSWNRGPLPQEGYRVVFQPLSGSAASGEFEIFADGFAGISPIPSPGEAEHRPVGLAQGPDGSLFISDSVQGTIWKVVYPES
ncbi:MAG: sorbosone dehydrogenase [Gemmatimonas sp.]|nr:sorbosone dehydrogenase [Gemmatimonas sp.]